MRKLILQMQTSFDLFVCDENGSTEGFIWNWEPTWNWDDKLQKEFIELTSSADCILLSRKMAFEGFIDYWHSISIQDENPAAKFAKATDLAKKIIFSRSEIITNWPNSVIATKKLKDAIIDLKNQNGGNLIAYGGVEFASELINSGLVDELIIYVNPIIFGRGKSIFESITGKIKLKLISTISYDCGVAILKYKIIT